MQSQPILVVFCLWNKGANFVFGTFEFESFVFGNLVFETFAFETFAFETLAFDTFAFDFLKPYVQSLKILVYEPLMFTTCFRRKSASCHYESL